MTKKKILIVDDDKDIQGALNIRLRANNYETFFAGDGVAAISEARKANPDLILLDIGLPAGSGFHVLDRIKQTPSLTHIPVIVVSARDAGTFKPEEMQMLKDGAKHFFQKPVDNDKLLAVIRKWLGE
jgi:DNA-binding response OmpR family regulator